ncbi:MAG: class I SAM-dependent methyltransferase [Candidatus Kapaibacteriales bacterium]
MQEIVYHTNFEVETNYWWFIARNQIVKKIALNFAELNRGDYILDVGCGTGGFAQLLSQDFNVLCLDISSIALEYCKDRGLTNLFQMPIEDFPKGIYKIRSIFMLDVIEHIEDDLSVIKSAFDLLDRDGTLILTVPAFRWLWSRHDEIHMHKRRYTRREIKELLNDCGFEVKFISYFNFFLFLPAVLKRLFDKNKNKIEPIEPVSNIVNKILQKIFMSEMFLLPVVRFPFGLSILAIAKKSDF